ncbi:hypothetical protein [Virgibacillus halodenitrificans]|uniref:hypothetical protein n=1 Tax=Virgibacillus halodenitrificans TaxID=1482 RepID=UPI001F34E422|nr:hypothetical protein [Virgibacillus halodenitrificans]
MKLEKGIKTQMVSAHQCTFDISLFLHDDPTYPKVFYRTKTAREENGNRAPQKRRTLE